ncbi:MAG: phage major tail tube protein [Rhodobacteraceae bacterium]|nr:phage major tail tube protein [Paracoccaceae bacterium]
MSYPRTIRGFNAFIDGIGYFGRVTEAKLPMLTLQTEEHRGAGMDQPIAIDMGMERMTTEVVFAEWAPELMMHFGTRKRLVLRPGAMGEDSFAADTIIATIGARWTGVEPGQLKQGSTSVLTLKASADYFRLEHNGTEICEIDVENGKRVIGGEDQLASLRAAMGL